MTIRTLNKQHRALKCFTLCFMVAIMMSFMISPCFAIASAGLGAVMKIVVDIVTTAATYVGAIISIWGIFQIIMAMRREDSEAISKQIMTVVVGAVLIGFGTLMEPLLGQLGVTIG